MNGCLLHEEQQEILPDDKVSATTATSEGAPKGGRRVRISERKVGKVTRALSSEAGGEFTIEVFEHLPSLGLSSEENGTGTIINWKGERGGPKGPKSSKRDRSLTGIDGARSSRNHSVLDPYLPGPKHIYDLDEVASSLILKHYPVVEPDLFDVEMPVPPPPTSVEEETARVEARGPLPTGPQISEHQARAALLAHVADRCCWGSGAAKQLTIDKINYDSAFHYELQTFTEKRETSWAFTPYGGGDIDGPSSGPAPLPWEVDAVPAHLFHDEVKVLQVPHTASVKECHRCKGSGSLQCSECHGKGWTRCMSCHGDGWYTDSSGYKDRCFYCQSVTHGHGRQDCLKCNAKGRVACPPCDSYGQIRCFIRLTISWKVNTAEHIVRKGGLPEEKVKEVSGQVAFEEEGPSIIPLSQFPDSTINLASAQLVNNHKNNFFDERIIAQRHQVRLVPVAEVEYGFKAKPGKFWIYGYENKCHSPDYPHTCCWGCCCSIM